MSSFAIGEMLQISQGCEDKINLARTQTKYTNCCRRKQPQAHSSLSFDE
jgi:hypothetical protein